MSEESEIGDITPWSGGDCPVPSGTGVRLFYRNGTTWDCVMPAHQRWERYLNEENPRDIVGYALLAEPLAIKIRGWPLR